jgi:flagellar motor switch protein FliN/FliY
MDSMTGESDDKSHDEIEDLLRQAQQAAGPGTAVDAPRASGDGAPDTPREPAAEPTASVRATATQTAESPASPRREASPTNVGDDIHLLLQQAEQALASVDQPVDAGLEGIAPFQFRDFAGTPPSGDKATLELLKDVDLDLRIELGRTQMYLEDVLKLKRGSVVALDRLAGDPVDIYVNGRIIARGEVLVLNDNFCVRVAELLSGEDRR